MSGVNNMSVQSSRKNHTMSNVWIQKAASVSKSGVNIRVILTTRPCGRCGTLGQPGYRDEL